MKSFLSNSNAALVAVKSPNNQGSFSKSPLSVLQDSMWIKLILLTLFVLVSQVLKAQVLEGKIISAEVFAVQPITPGCDSTVKVTTFKAYITADGPCEASFKWLRSDGASSSTNQTIIFKEAGTKTITTTWSIWLPAYNGWEKIQFSKPNVLASNEAHFSIYCCEKDQAPNCKTNPYTINYCAQDLLNSFKSLVLGIDTRICNTRIGYITVSSAMNATCYTPSANLSGIVTYSSFYTPQDSAFRVSWSADDLGYDYYGACKPEPIVFPKGMPENHVFSALLIPVNSYKTSANKDNYELLKQDAIQPIDIADLLGWYIEPSSGYIATTEPLKYNNRYSSKGIVVKVRLKTGETILCYVLNNYDTGGTMYWKDACVGDDGVVTKIGQKSSEELLEDLTLSQNTPNPFTTDTEIRINVPRTAKQAVLTIYNLEGIAVREISVLERGATSIKINAAGLKAGLYIYRLAVDGDIYTKKMLLNK